MNVLLLGNPNVGKSSLFSRLTGTKIVTSNFPGTTFSITKGTLQCLDDACPFNDHQLRDAPGMYSLERDGQESREALRHLLAQADCIINVIDSTHLERNLYLTKQLLSTRKPMVIALNLWDEAGYRGIEIDVELLSQELRVPIIPTTSLTGAGARELVKAANKLLHTENTHTQLLEPPLPSWQDIRTITHKVQHTSPRKKTFAEYLESVTVAPIIGGFIAICILISSLGLVAFLGSYLEDLVEASFNLILTPALLKLHALLSNWTFIRELLIGSVQNNTINYGEAMGMLTSGLFIPLGKVAPVVTIFYFILGILEDCGYLPRLAVLSDELMHRFALHGFAIVPMMLGAGCSVTGIVATRMLTSSRQRIIASILLSMTIPCTAQIAVILSLTGKIGSWFVTALFLTLFALWYILGRVLGTTQKHSYRELLIEMPPYRMPRLRLMVPKLSFRLRNFFADAIPITIVGIFILLLCNYFQLFERLGHQVSTFFGTIWGLPPNVIPILLMGLFRKEIALSFLNGIGTLSTPQIFITALLLSIYFPCISVYTILYKEFGVKTLLKMVAFMFALSTSVGILAHGLFMLFA